MNYEAFQVEIKDYIATVTFDRPEKSNALHLKAWEEMKHIFDTMSDDPTVRVIIVAGSGKNFCAGIDLSLLMDLTRYTDISCEGRKREEIRKSIQFLQDSINAIEHCRKPVIAAIHRACIGGAVDIVSACDMRYCSDDAYFCIKEVDMGLVADIGTLQRLPKIVPYGIVSELAYTGRNVDAKEAANIGLVNRTYVDRDAMMSAVNEVAATIASKAPMVIRGTKEVLQYTRDHTVEESLNYIGLYNAAYLLNDDIQEAMRAQMMRDKPTFTGS